MPTNKKQIMDVAKPGKTASQPTARPVIIGHGAMIKDPMVTADPEPADALMPERDEAEKAPKQATHGELIVKPIQDTASDETDNAMPVGKTSDPDVHEEDEAQKDHDIKQSAKETTTEEQQTAEVHEDKVTDDAVVDAVVSQATLKKESKDAESKQLEQDAALQKLIDDKTYFVRIGTEKRQQKQYALWFLLVLLALGVFAYVAADAGAFGKSVNVPFHLLPQPAAETKQVLPTAQPAATPAATQPTSVVPEGFVAYKNQTLGVSFQYPTVWGEVSTGTTPATKGSSTLLTFSKQPLVRAGMMTRDYAAGGADGMCYVVLGLPPGVALSAVKSSYAEGQQTASATYRTSLKYLKNTDTQFAYESFEAGNPDGLGACPGLSISAYKSFASTARQTGIQFFWHDETLTSTSIPVTKFTEYQNKPANFISEADRAAVLSVVDSVQPM